MELLCVCVLCGAAGEDAWADIRCVATDGGSAFDTALSTVLPGVPRILCLFHITENVKRHFYSVLGAQYTIFIKAWMQLINGPNHEEEFELVWAQLMSEWPAVKEYFQQQLFPTRHRWADVWTKRFTTFGARTTQRSESVNRVLKYFLEQNSTLERLFTVVMDVAGSWQASNVERVKESRFTNHSASGPVYTEAVKTLTREAAVHVYTESLYVTNYRVLRFHSPPAGCSALLYHPSSTRVLYAPSWNDDSSASPSYHHSTSSSYHHMVSSPYLCDDAIMVSPSRHSSSGVTTVPDPYHPHTAADLPDEGDVYFVRHRVPESESRTVHQTHWVRVRKGSATCTDCPSFTNWLLPCRHVLAVNLVRWPADSIFVPGQCHRRWRLSPSCPAPTLPSSTAAVAPLQSAAAVAESLLSTTDEEVPRGGISSDRIYRLWTPAAERVCGFIQPHGHAGLLYAMSVLEHLITQLRSGGKGVPQEYIVTPNQHTQRSFPCHHGTTKSYLNVMSPWRRYGTM